MTQADRETLRIITGWLNDLSRLVRHGEEKPTKEQMALYATMLAKDLPSGAFTSDSLHAAAVGMTWWPEYDALRVKAIAWWRDHKPFAAPLIPYEGQKKLSAEERRWLDFYHRRKGQIDVKDHREIERLESLIRQEAPGAWKLIRGKELPDWQPTPGYFQDLRGVIHQVAEAKPPESERTRQSTFTPEQLQAMRLTAQAQGAKS